MRTIGTMTTGAVITTESVPYQTDEADANTTYIRWENTLAVQLVQRVSVSGNVTTIAFARTTWANRATATYNLVV